MSLEQGKVSLVIEKCSHTVEIWSLFPVAFATITHVE